MVRKTPVALLVLLFFATSCAQKPVVQKTPNGRAWAEFPGAPKAEDAPARGGGTRRRHVYGTDEVSLILSESNQDATFSVEESMDRMAKALEEDGYVVEGRRSRAPCGDVTCLEMTLRNGAKKNLMTVRMALEGPVVYRAFGHSLRSQTHRPEVTRFLQSFTVTR